jgi:histidyl-tRNA synthetase
MSQDTGKQPRKNEEAGKSAVQRPKGTRDFIPVEMEKRRWLETRLRTAAGLFGFREVATPAFEHVELFTMRSGQGIIEDMYDFRDKGGRHLALRPELTAPTMRLYIEGLLGEPKPLKLFYFGNCFRYEQPQKGRYREFWQFGAEILGAKRVPGEVELLALADACLKASGLKRYILRIGHVGVLRKLLEDSGVPAERQAPLMPLIDKKDHEALGVSLEGLGADRAHVMDVLGSSGGREVLAKVPGSGLEDVLDGLASAGVDGYVIEPGIARGLDYYTGMVFEADVPDLGAEKQVLGGGTYALSELLGAESIESTGFAIGFDRVLVALEAQGTAIPPVKLDFYIIPMGPSERKMALEALAALRKAGLSADIDMADRSLSKALKYASSSGASRAIIIGENEIRTGTLSVKDLATGEQRSARLEELAGR